MPRINRKGKPYGSEAWVNRMIDKFNLRSTLRSPGRTRKGSRPHYQPLSIIIAILDKAFNGKLVNRLRIKS